MSTATTPAATSAHVCTEAHTHVIQPPTIPPGEHAWQRRYGANPYNGTKATANSADPIDARATVFRDEGFDLAELTLQLGNHNAASIRVLYTPAQLRDLAGRLLDAAADIEAYPAAVLTQGGAA